MNVLKACAFHRTFEFLEQRITPGSLLTSLPELPWGNWGALDNQTPTSQFATPPLLATEEEWTANETQVPFSILPAASEEPNSVQQAADSSIVSNSGSGIVPSDSVLLISWGINSLSTEGAEGTSDDSPLLNHLDDAGGADGPQPPTGGGGETGGSSDGGATGGGAASVEPADHSVESSGWFGSSGGATSANSGGPNSSPSAGTKGSSESVGAGSPGVGAGTPATSGVSQDSNLQSPVFSNEEAATYSMFSMPTGMNPLALTTFNDWTIVESGGTETGLGTVEEASEGGIVLREGDSFYVGIQQEIMIPHNPNLLSFAFTDLAFDATAQNSIKDAFEVALVDDQGRTVVDYIGVDRNAFFNISEDTSAALGSGTILDSQLVTLDISNLTPNSTATLKIRLVNNDADTETTVRILTTGLAGDPPSLSLDLANDTAPAGAAGDPYRTDRLTNDGRLRGTATDDGGVLFLELSIDGDDFFDITGTLDGDEYSFSPDALPPGEHSAIVRARDIAGQTTERTITFRINTPPTAAPGSPVTINEGDSTTRSSSSSSDLEAAIFAHQWTFHDLTSLTGPVVNRSYAENGVYTEQLTVTDTAGSMVNASVVVTVVNLAPSVAAISDQSSNEGDVVSLSASYSDPGFLDTHTATIDWGDETVESANVSEALGTGTASKTHIYAQQGSYEARLVVTDDEGASTTRTFNVTVGNAAPIATSASELTGNEGQSLNFSGMFSDNGILDTHTAVIDWGDGTQSVGNVAEVNGSGTVTGSHVYADNGTYTVRLVVTDNSSASAARSTTATIINVAPNATVADNHTVNEGSSLSLTLATFTDPGYTHSAAGTTETFTTTIDWGDGSPLEAGELTITQGSTGVLTSGSLAGWHTYANNGTYTVAIVVSDDDQGTTTESFTVEVTNVAPVLLTTEALAGQEGQSLNFSGAFSDAGVLDTHTAVIEWGDGTQSNGSVSEANGEGSVTASHVYADDGMYTLRLIVTDSTNASATFTTTATISNVAPTVTAANHQVVNEGAALSLTLATFTDPGFTRAVAGTTETFTTSIDWGDGTSSQAGDLAVTQGSAGVLTSGSLAGSHTYANDGTYTVTITVRDDNQGTATESFTVQVANVAPVSLTAEALTGPEGQSLNFSGAFSDAGVLDTHTAIIEWGDGTQSTGSVSEVDGEGSVTANHVYADNGTYTVRLIVTDNSSASATYTTTTTIANVAPTVTAANNQTVNEGSALSLTLATFTDPGFTRAVAGTTETFTTSIDWGDGTSSQTGELTLTQGSAGVLTSGGLAGTHLYGANGTYTVTITVSDDDQGTTTESFAVQVVNAPPVVSTAEALTGQEGQSLSFSGTFTDSGLTDTHTAIIEWGDGTQSAGVVTEANGSGTVTGSHVYADNGMYTMRLVVIDSASASATRSTTATIANVAPTVTAASNQTVNEGSALALTLATLTDPGFTRTAAGTTETFTTWIDWGDGTSSQTGDLSVTQGSAGTLTSGSLAGTHTYANNGTYTVTITVSDDDQGTTTQSFTVAVNNVAPAALTADALSGQEGQSLNFSGTFSDAGVFDTHTAIIEWGDGAQSTGSVSEANGNGIVTGSHVYADNGTYPVRLIVTDSSSASTTLSTMATITNAAPTVTAAGNQTVNEGSVLSLTLASFTDPGFTNAAAGTSETFTATINWGDGSSPPAGDVTLTQGSAGVLTIGGVLGSHTYADNGSYTVTVSVSDDDTGTSTASLTVTVGNVAPLVDAAGPYGVAYGGTVGLQGTFSDVGSLDSSANATVSWDLDGDGTFGETGEAATRGDEITLTPTFAAPASLAQYTVTLRVTDKDGSIGQDTAVVAVNAVKFDFNYDTTPTQGVGTPTPTQAGYVGVMTRDIFGATNQQFGWSSPWPGQFVRSLPSGSYLADLLHDGHYGPRDGGVYTFSARIPNGAYLVNLTMGDAMIAHEGMRVRAENGQVVLSSLSNPAGQFVQASFSVGVQDDILNLDFYDESGNNRDWVLNAIEIVPFEDVDGTLSFASPEALVPDGLTPLVFTATTSLPDGSLFTLSTNRGAIVATDASSLYAGIQVAASSGQITFDVLSEDYASVTVTAFAIDGQARGSATADYVIPESRHLDFNASPIPGSPNNDTALGFQNVFAADNYTATRGFGWLSTTGIGEFQRSSAAGALRRDGHFSQTNTTIGSFFMIMAEPSTSYSVRVYVGDYSIARSNIQVTIEGKSPYTISSLAAGQFDIRDTANVSDIDGDGRISIRFRNTSGGTWVANGIEIWESGSETPPQMLMAPGGSGGISDTESSLILRRDSWPTITSNDTELSLATWLESLPTIAEAGPIFLGFQEIDEGGSGSGGGMMLNSGSNTPPESSNITFSDVPHDREFIAAAPGVLLGAFDWEDDELTAILVEEVNFGELSLNDDGSFVYTPPDHFLGLATFKFKVSDGQAESAVCIARLLVVNDPPQAVDDSYTFLHDRVLVTSNTQHPYGVLHNDYDHDPDPFTMTLQDDVAHGELELHEDGTFTYTPNWHFVGVDSFRYLISDGLDSEIATVTLTVVNTPPLASDDQYSMSGEVLYVPVMPLYENGPLGIWFNDRDYDNDPLDRMVIADFQHGTLELNADGSFFYVPMPGFAGVDTLTYRVSDGIASDQAIVTINVQNAVPLAVDDSYSVLH